MTGYSLIMCVSCNDFVIKLKLHSCQAKIKVDVANETKTNQPVYQLTGENCKKCAHYKSTDFVSWVFGFLTNKYKNAEVNKHLVSQTDS